MSESIDLTRAHRADSAREALGDDFFGGWTKEDFALFAKYAVTDAEVRPSSVTDFLGVKTDVEFVPWAKHFAGQRLAAPPIPDDSIRAEAIEYFAVLHAFDTAPSRARFTLAELGASFGPWICTAGVVARRLGFQKIRLIAVEASQFMHRLIRTHLENNDLRSELLPGLYAKVLCGAVWVDESTLYFPKVTSAMNNGFQASSGSVDTDCVGRTVESVPVQGMTLPRILGDEEQIDLLHIDIHGAEAQVVPKAIDLLNARVRRLLLGTHSRYIDGLMMKIFHEAGWVLLRERPTKFTFVPALGGLDGMTTRDGGQYWINPRLQPAT